MSILKVMRHAALTVSLLLITFLGFGEDLQSGFGSLVLGMTIDEAKENLSTDPNFDYRGDPDVSFSPATQAPIIQTDGTAFVARAILQFDQDRLYSITLALDQHRLDYYSVFVSLSERYGDPRTLDPDAAIWSDERVRLSLERPLTLKYLDAQRFEQLREEYRAAESLDAITREAFLEQL